MAGPSGPLTVGYEDMDAFKAQLGTKVDAFQRECHEMHNQLEALLGSWSGSKGAQAFEGVCQTISKQINDLSQNLDSTQQALGLANNYYAESDQAVATGLSQMVD